MDLYFACGYLGAYWMTLGKIVAIGFAIGVLAPYLIMWILGLIFKITEWLEDYYDSL